MRGLIADDTQLIVVRIKRALEERAATSRALGEATSGGPQVSRSSGEKRIPTSC